MAKSLKDLNVRGKGDKRRAKIQKVTDLRRVSQNMRQSFEPYWLRDQKDLEGYVDPDDKKHFQYRSRLRIPFAEYMRQVWVDNESAILLDEDHPIELTGREGVAEESLDTRQTMLEHQLYLSGFSWKLIDLLRAGTGGGTGIWQVVRETGEALRDVNEPIVDPDTGEITGVRSVEKMVPWPYFGVNLKPVSVWDFWPDPGAENMLECMRCVTRHLMTKPEIQRRWPETQKIPDKAEGKEIGWNNFPTATSADDYRRKYDTATRLNHTAPAPGEGVALRYAVEIMWDAEEDEIIVTLGDSILLDYQSMEKGDKRLPFVMCRYMPWGGKGGDYFFGKSLPHTIHALSSAAECILNMHMDVTKQIIHPQLVVNRMAQVNLNDLRHGEPGIPIQVFGDPSSAIQQLRKDIPAGTAALAELDFIHQMLQVASNVNNLTMGNPTSPQRTATGVVTLTQSAKSGFVQHAKRTSSECLEPLGDKINDAIDVMYTKPQVMWLIGADGKGYERRWTYEEMVADVITRPKRLRDHSEKAMKAQQWMQLAQAGALQDPRVDGQEGYRRLFKSLGERDIPKLLPQMIPMMMKARQPVDPAQSFREAMTENQQLVDEGFMKSPMPDEDDQAHMETHNLLVNSARFAGLPETSQMAMHAHLLGHEAYRNYEMQIDQMLATQQQMPANAQPGMEAQSVGPDVLQGAMANAGSPSAPRNPITTPETVGQPVLNMPRGGVAG